MSYTPLPVVRTVFTSGSITVAFSFYRSPKHPAFYTWNDTPYTHIEFVLQQVGLEVRFLETTLPTMAAVLRAAAAQRPQTQTAEIGSIDENLPDRNLVLFRDPLAGYIIESHRDKEREAAITIDPWRMPIVLAALESVPVSLSVNKRFEKAI